MNVTTLILAILNAGDATGYEIKKMSSDGQFSHFIDMSFGSIYPTLSKLEKEKLVTCRAEAQSGKPDRKVYSITNAGRIEFVSAISQPPAPDKFKSEFLLVAMNAGLADKSVMQKAIEDRIAFLNGKLEMIRDILSDCEHPTKEWVCKYAMHCISSDLEYLKQNKDQILALTGIAPQATLGEAAE